MLLQTRPTAVKISVLALFIVAIIGHCYGASSFYCCKRALLATVIAYFVTTLFIKAVNFVLLNAMIDKEVEKQREINRDN